MRALFIPLLLLSSVLPEAHAQAKQMQLLPGSATAAIQLQWRQDGRVLDLTLRNQSATWTVTDVTLIVEFKQYQPPPEPPSAPRSPTKPKPTKPTSPPSGIDAIIASGYRYIEPPETHERAIVIPATRESTLRLELKSESNVASIRIKEARGREPSVLENLSNMVR